MLKLFWLAFTINSNDVNLPKSTANLSQVITNIVQTMMGLLGAVAVAFLIYGGIQLAYSRGNPKNVERGRETILYACVGLITAIAGFAIVSFITGRIK
jgi:hypothetical protein